MEGHAPWLTTPDGSEYLPDDLEENLSDSDLLRKQYLDYVCKYPGVFESLAGVFEVELPAGRSSSVPPSLNLDTNYAEDCVCAYCGKIFDRPTRARDCRNRDLGLTPHKCLGMCGVVGWSATSSPCVRYVLNPQYTSSTASYASEAVLLEHINLREMRCPWW